MLSTKHKALALASSLGLLAACSSLSGEEVGRSTFTAVSTPGHLVYQRTKLHLVKGEKIQFWADMDIAYDGPLQLEFFVQLPKVMHIPSIALDPLRRDPNGNEINTVTGQHTSRRFTSRIGSFEAPITADYDFGTLFLSSGNPTLQITSAALVFRK